MPVVYEKGRVNVFNIVGFVFVLVAQAVTATTLWVNLSRDVQDVRETQAERAAIADKFNEAVRTQLTPIPALNYQQSRQAEQIEELKHSIADTNKRFDKMVDMVSGKLDLLTSNVSDVRADLRVLTQEVRGREGEARPTAFHTN